MQHKAIPAMPGVTVSAIGFGCWSLGGGSGWEDSSDSESIATVHKALDCGITFFDTAPVYGFGGSERLLGRALGSQRNAIFLASKCGLLWKGDHVIYRSLKASDILADVEASLMRLGTDHLDLLQLHWPDHTTPLEETAEALETLLAAGKTRFVGVSNFSLADTKRLSTMVPVASFQGLYNLCERNPSYYHALELEYRTEREILPYCAEAGLAFIPYSPLFQGVLTGTLTTETRFVTGDVRLENPKLNGPLFPRYIAAADDLDQIARDAGMTLVELSLSWLTSKPVISSVVCGAQHPDQIAANAKAGDITLTADLMNAIDAILLSHGLEAS
jgi:aryl-alcohol dehydrogenase-like predicted oxidoreductase